MNHDLISIVVPIYNVEKYLKKCVQSILVQTYSHLEIILVDDESPDNCGKMCDTFQEEDARVKVIHKKNGGLSDARNAGIELASGKYITFIDSDDTITFDYIEVLYQSIQENHADISIGGLTVIYDTNAIIEKNTCDETILTSEETLEKILYDEGIDLCAVAKLYKRDLFDKIRFPVGRLYEDAATTYKVIDSAKRISVIHKRIYNYVIRRTSITNCSFNRKKMDLIFSTKEMCDFITLKYPNLEKACERRLMYAYLSTLSQLASSNESHKKEQYELMEYVRRNSKKVLKDHRLPKRDRFALYILKFGYHFYKLFWNLYRKWSKRI